MATTITAADFTASLSEGITLGSVDFTGNNSYLASSCTEADQRIVNVALKAAEGSPTYTTLFDWGAVNNAGQGITTEFKYFRFTNLDDTNYVLLQVLLATTNKIFTIKLKAGDSFMLQDGNMFVGCSEEEAYPTLESIKQVRAAADTAACDIEIFTVFSRAE